MKLKSIAMRFFISVTAIVILFTILTILDVPILVLLPIIATCAILTTLFFSLYIRRQNRMIETYLMRVGSGDVTAKLPKEISSDFASIASIVTSNNKNTKGMIGKMLTTSEQLLNLIEVIKHSGDEMEQSFSLVSRNVNEISHSVDNMSKESLDMQHDAELMREDMQKMLSNSKNAEEISEFMKNNLDTNNRNTSELIERMRMSAERNMTLSKEVRQLRDEMHKIIEIVNVISDISSQTNLLALNASIEAARAGDAGRGFAVVAEEVRKLAEQSNHSSEGISKMINDIVGKTDTITNQISEEVKNANENVRFADASNALLSTSYSSVQNTIDIIKQIIEEIHVQSTSTENVYKLIRNISDESQEVTANVEETAALTDIQLANLSEIVSSLDRLLGISNALGSVVNDYKKGLKVSDEVSSKIESSLKILKAFISEHPVDNINGIKQSMLLDIKKKSPDFELVALLDEKGMAFAFSQDVGVSNVDASHRPFYKESIKGRDFRSEPYISSMTEEYCISVSVPVWHDKKVIGVLMLDITI